MKNKKQKRAIEFEQTSDDVAHQKIAVKIVSLIRERHLGPGDRLPPERELALMIGVSRPTLRESLKALSILNILEMRQGDGTYVSSLEIERLIEPFNYFLTMDYPSLAQLFEVRKVVEIAAIDLAARRATEEDINFLENCLKRAIDNKDNPEAFLQADIDLHEGVAAAAGNPLLSRFIISLRVVGKASREKTVKIPGVIEMTVNDHARIVETIKKRDSSAAKRAMNDHLEHIEKSIQQDFFSG